MGARRHGISLREFDILQVSAVDEGNIELDNSCLGTDKD